MYKLPPNVHWIPFRRVRRSKEGKHVVEFPPDLPLIVETYKLEIDHHFTPHFHDYLEITYICKGNGICVIGNKRYRLQPGNVVVIGPNDLHSFWSDYTNPVYFIVVFFVSEIIYTAGQDTFNKAYIEPFFFGLEKKHFQYNELPDDTIPELMWEMYFLEKNRPNFYKHRQKALMFSLLSSVRTAFFNEEMVDNVNKVKYLVRLKPVLDMVRSKSWGQMNIENAASMVSFSKYHFCRVFKELTGMTFIEYVHRVRIDKAKELLRDSDYSVSYIAVEVGFENISFFNRVFRKLTGICPTYYRRLIHDSSEKRVFREEPAQHIVYKRLK